MCPLGDPVNDLGHPFMGAFLHISDRGAGERILIVQTSFLGDVVLTTPLISELRRRFPEARLAILCTPAARGLLEANPDLDDIITDDKKSEGSGIKGLWIKARQLNAQNFTVAVSPHKSLRTALLLTLAGIPYRIGFRQSTGWFFYHDRVDRNSRSHDVERNLSILKPFGIEPWQCVKRLRVEVSPAARATVARLFQSLGVERKEGKVIVGLNPGSVWPTKRWSAERYAELVRRLKQTYDCEVLLFGGPDDAAIVDRIQGLVGHLGRNLVGRTSLAELAGALEWCDVFITNDSMPMHVAVARGVPVVAVFCATTPGLGFYPYSSRAVVVEKSLPCRPCALHGGLRCPLGTEDCIRLIPAEEVMQAVKRLLSHRGQTSGEDRADPVPEFVSL